MAKTARVVGTGDTQNEAKANAYSRAAGHGYTKFRYDEGWESISKQDPSDPNFYEVTYYFTAFFEKED